MITREKIVIHLILLLNCLFLFSGNLYFCKESRFNRLKELFEHHLFVCTCPACRGMNSTLFPLLKDQKIIHKELFRMTAAAAKGIKTWNRNEARQKYLHFIEMLQNYHTPLPTQELSFLQHWLFIILAMTDRPDLSY